MEEYRRPLVSKTTVSVSRDTVAKLRPLIKYGESMGDKITEIVEDYLKRLQPTKDDEQCLR